METRRFADTDGVVRRAENQVPLADEMALETNERHAREIHANKAAWEKKPVIRKLYTQFYQRIARHLLPEDGKLTVELGSGLGNIKSVLPTCITTDLFNNPWIDQVESAYSLSFPENSIRNLILMDVWHHLQYPGTALREFERVLAPNGRIILVEPAMGLLGRLVFGLFHPEPIGWNKSIEWFAPEDVDLSDTPYFTAQANCWKMVRDGLPKELKNWAISRVETFASLSYAASGGFSGPQLYPSLLLPLIQRMDVLMDKLPSLFATRMLVVLEPAK
jgi:SAM-dependent methyltransferase